MTAAWSTRSNRCSPTKAVACDVMRLRHRTGIIYYINLFSMGFSADVATLRARRFSGWGELGYFTSIFLTLARFNRRPFPVRVEGQRCLR